MFSFLLLLIIVIIILTYRTEGSFFHKNLLKGHENYSVQRKRFKKFLNGRARARVAHKYKRERQKLDRENTRYHLNIFAREIIQELHSVHQHISPKLIRQTEIAIRVSVDREKDEILIQIFNIVTSENKAAMESNLSSYLKNHTL